MTLIVVDQEEESVLDAMLGVNNTLRLYQTDVTSGLTVAEQSALTEADFTEATFTGYSASTLTGGSWTVTPGDPSSASYAQQTFTSTANQTSQTIYGYYVTRSSDGKLRWFERFTNPVTVALNGDAIKVTPQITASGKIDLVARSGDTMTGPLTVNAVGTDEEPPDVLVGGDTGLNILSSFEGGEDDGTGTDTTGRINLYSYQRASTYSFGENIRHFMMRGNAKSMDAWYFPDGGYDENLEPVGTFKPVVWTGAHWQANDGLSNHKHWSVETPDSTGAIQTRFEIRFGDTSVDDEIAGLDKTLIMTNLADFVVRCTNGQEFRLAASAGTSKGVMFSNDSEGGAQYRRWRIEATSDAESGGGAGTNFRVTRYDDSGERIDDPISISRSTGNVTLGPGFIARRSTATVSSLSLNTTSLGGGEGVIAIGNASTPPPNTPSGGGVLYVEDGALKFKGSSGTVTTIANA